MSTTKAVDLCLSVQPEVRDMLVELAMKNGFEVNDLCSTVLTLWTKHGGSIWMGRKGFVVDWPLEYAFCEKKELDLRK
jgi:hypothetical protein